MLPASRFLVWLERPIVNGGALVLIGLIFILLVGRTFTRIGEDFHVFYVAGERLWAGASLYQPSDGWLPYKYHPAWAGLFAGLTFFPERLSFLIFNSVQLACWCAATAIWMRWLGYRATDFVAFLIVLLCSANMLSTELGYGQVNGFLLLAGTKLVDWMERDAPRWFVAGATAAVLTALKLNFGLLAIYCLIKDVRAGLGLISVAVLFHVVSVVSGLGEVEVYREWLSLLFTQSAEQYRHQDAQGLLRLLLATLGDKGGTIAWFGALIVFVTGGLVLSQRKAPRTDIGAYWIAGCYLLSPLAWWYQVLFMFPMAALLLKTRLEQWERRVLIACISIAALIGADLLSPRGVAAFKQVYGTLILSLVVLAIFVRRRMITSVQTNDAQGPLARAQS